MIIVLTVLAVVQAFLLAAWAWVVIIHGAAIRRLRRHAGASQTIYHGSPRERTSMPTDKDTITSVRLIQREGQRD